MFEGLNIIAISGKQRSGKDTFATMLLEELGDNWIRTAFADAIKEKYCQEKNLTFDEVNNLKNTDGSVRKRLIEIGDAGRRKDPDYWIDKALENASTRGNNIVITDLRFKREADKLHEYGARLLRIWSSFYVRSKRGVLSNETDRSEIDLDGYPKFSHLVINNGTLIELKEQAIVLARLYCSRR